MKPLHYLLASYLCLLLAGGLWGLREKVHQTPDVFHRLCPDRQIPAVSFFGRQMWRMKYEPEGRVARQLLQWFPINDFWHSSWYVIKILFILGVWLAYRSGTYFWDFRRLHLLLIWYMVITMFWAGAANWLISLLLR